MRYEDQEVQVLGFVAGFIAGVAVGAGVALLTAPEKGRKTRRRIVRAASDARGTAQDRLEAFAQDVRERVDDAVQAARKTVAR
ncbi:MAG: YtxH domain-containing protein [Longimicrobiales bacterium]|nr:YtxH domain-containing protein [Longimicrobiales bacterium]